MKEKSIILNVMSGNPGEILEKTRSYCVKKLDNGCVEMKYNNSSQEPCLLKLTFTALNPCAEFVINIDGKSDYTLRANIAGILENRFTVESGRSIIIREVR